MRRIAVLAVAALSAVLVLLVVTGVSGAQSSSGQGSTDTNGTKQTYIMLYREPAVPSDAKNVIEKAGGTLAQSYNEIGVAIARSDNASFRDNVMKDRRIEGAAPTKDYAVKLRDDLAGKEDAKEDAQGPPAGDLPNAPATDTDTFSPLQWDMRQIHTNEVHKTTGGSPSVVVGDIDTGIDTNHPDLTPNIDLANSTSCLSGAPTPNPADDNGHGTHTAGTIAAANNGLGIVGTAPNVKIAAIKAGDANGFFFPEAVICAFVWAGSHHVDVVNNSYFADPFLYNCRNDEVQRAIWKAEQRAILYAQKQGVTVVSSIGNESDDLAHPAYDVTSPDFPPGQEQERAITNACVVIPVEIPGVIGVTGVGNTRQADSDDDPNDYLKAFFSSYGVGVAEVTAPSGDSVFGRTAEAPNGRVLSTYPADKPCVRSVKEPTSDPNYPTAVYCYLQGTSMAAPHVSGVAALIISRFGDLQNPQNGKMRPEQVAAYLQQTADPQPCPTTLPPGYETFTRPAPGGVTPEPQACQSGQDYNSWYGSGQVNASKAVTHTASNG